MRLHYHLTFASMLTLLAACGGLELESEPAPGSGNRTKAPETEACWGTPGGSGGAGGNGGQIALRFGTLLASKVDALVGSLHVTGGHGGAPGSSGTPVPGGASSPARHGANGNAGAIDVRLQPQLSLDLSGIETDDALLVSANNIYLKTKMLQGPLRVDRLIVSGGASLKLSGGWVIEAREVLVSPGASIIISDRGDRSEDVFGSAVGQQGGSLVLRAETLMLHGDIIASGVDGEPGSSGGRGGRVLVEAQTIQMGAEGAIHASGGNGGQGAAGRSCP